MDTPRSRGGEMSGPSWFGFVIEGITPQTHRVVQLEVHRYLAELYDRAAAADRSRLSRPWFPETEAGDLRPAHDFSLVYGLRDGCAFVHLEHGEQFWEAFLTLHMNLGELAPRLARALSTVVWDYHHEQRHDWFEYATAYGPDGSVIREFAESVEDCMARLPIDDEDEAWDAAHSELATARLAAQLGMTQEDFVRLSEERRVVVGLMDDVGDPLTNAEPAPGPSRNEKIEVTFELPVSLLEDIHSEAMRQDRSLSWIVQFALKHGQDKLATQSASSVQTSPTARRRQQLFMLAGMYEDIGTEATRLSCDPSQVVELSWALARDEVRQLPSVQD